MAKFIVPLDKFEQLEAVLINNKYNFLLYEDKISSLIFPSEIIELHRDNIEPLLKEDESVFARIFEENIFEERASFLHCSTRLRL